MRRSRFRCGSRGTRFLMASRRDQQREEVRLRVMRLLENNPNISTREIAATVGISNGSAFYCLNALVQKGLVKLGNFSASSNKGRYAYILTRNGLKEKSTLTTKFLSRKRREFDSLKSEIAELENDLLQENPSVFHER